MARSVSATPVDVGNELVVPVGAGPTVVSKTLTLMFAVAVAVRVPANALT